jgi:hypothetical protein
MSEIAGCARSTRPSVEVAVIGALSRILRTPKQLPGWLWLMQRPAIGHLTMSKLYHGVPLALLACMDSNVPEPILQQWGLVAPIYS